MSAAAVFDTETTGVDAPDVIELAYAGPLASPLDRFTRDEVVCSKFTPRKPITLGAMATHNIIEDDLRDAPPWTGTWSPPPTVLYLVAHNVEFDWQAIGAPANLKTICTLALARRAWPLLDSHKLAAVVYHLYPHPVARNMVRDAHSAAADVWMLGCVLAALVKHYEPRDWQHLHEMSEVARVPTHMTFGSKYSPYQYPPLGMPIADMRKRDPGYVRWLLANADIVKQDRYWQKALTQ